VYDKGGNIVKKPNRPTLDQFFGFINNYRKKIDYKAGILCIIAFTVLTISTIYISTGSPKPYVIKVNNKIIGYVSRYDIYSNAIQKIKAENKDVSLKNVTAERTNIIPDAFITSTTIQKAMTNEVKANVKEGTVAIQANNVQIAIVANNEDAKRVIEGVKEYYYPKIQNAKVTIKSSNILESISVKDIKVDPKSVLSVSAAIKKIVNGRGAEKKYMIKDGDTIWDVAVTNNINIEDIKAANPDINMDKIKIGQVIKLAVNLPYVNVRIIAKIDSKEQIPYDSKKVTDKKIRTGYKKVKMHGRNGVAQIIKNVVIENGDLIDENVIVNKTLIAAKDEIVVVGGKTPLYAATGSFLKPARGRLSSPFGRRWGKMHEGIDLAGPTGTPIEAADSGKISFVGRRSGYGLCVMINHGNGLQTLYGHTSKVFVKAGQSVAKGQRIASIGSTGRSTGPHLHFEVRKNGIPVNPLAYIK
jgi:murein DD-endopeptidase MepM/ murein hydrolase activator NlpD